MTTIQNLHDGPLFQITFQQQTYFNQTPTHFCTFPHPSTLALNKITLALRCPTQSLAPASMSPVAADIVSLKIIQDTTAAQRRLAKISRLIELSKLRRTSEDRGSQYFQGNIFQKCYISKLLHSRIKKVSRNLDQSCVNYQTQTTERS